MFLDLTNLETVYIAFHVATLMIFIIFGFDSGEDSDDF